MEGFFPSFNALDFLKRFNKNHVSDYEFEVFIKQISYSRFLKSKKVDNQLTTNQYITNLVRGFSK